MAPRCAATRSQMSGHVAGRVPRAIGPAHPWRESPSESTSRGRLKKDGGTLGDVALARDFTKRLWTAVAAFRRKGDVYGDVAVLSCFASALALPALTFMSCCWRRGRIRSAGGEGVGVVVGLQKLSVGSGYEYLNRNAAVFDATGRGHGSLADSCSAKGVPARMGTADGLAAVGVRAGDVVSADQVKLLLWAGLDPRAGKQLGLRFSVFGHQPPRSRSSWPADWM